MKHHDAVGHCGFALLGKIPLLLGKGLVGFQKRIQRRIPCRVFCLQGGLGRMLQMGFDLTGLLPFIPQVLAQGIVFVADVHFAKTVRQVMADHTQAEAFRPTALGLFTQVFLYRAQCFLTIVVPRPVPLDQVRVDASECEDCA